MGADSLDSTRLDLFQIDHLKQGKFFNSPECFGSNPGSWRVLEDGQLACYNFLLAATCTIKQPPELLLFQPLWLFNFHLAQGAPLNNNPVECGAFWVWVKLRIGFQLPSTATWSQIVMSSTWSLSPDQAHDVRRVSIIELHDYLTAWLARWFNANQRRSSQLETRGKLCVYQFHARSLSFPFSFWFSFSFSFRFVSSRLSWVRQKVLSTSCNFMLWKR